MEEEAIVVNKGDNHDHDQDLLDLPPGFRFHPTDEELITHYLTEKVINCSFTATAIGEADLNKCEPWDLPKKAKMGEKEWYFFCQRDRKYPTGTRTNRATESGYWKATGKDKEIFKGKGSSCQLVGMKKTLVFYRGRAPKGEKTNWVMHEYRLEGKFAYNLSKSAQDEWAVSRVFHKCNGINKVPMINVPTLSRINSFADDLLLDYSSNPLPPHNSISNHTYDNNFPETGLNPFSVNANTSNYSYQSNLFTNPIPNLPSQLYPQTAVQNPQYFSFQDQELCSSNNYLNQGIKSFTSSSMPVFINNGSSALERHREQLIMKAEPFSSNHSMVTLSQDTGLSNDVNTTTEITSSAMSSKQEVAGTSISRSFVEDLLIEGSSAVGAMSDLELWEY